MPDAFTPKHFPRTKLPTGRFLSDAQQYQYDVLRSVGGSLIQWSRGWSREQPDHSRVLVYGLNATAMWKLVELGLVDCIADLEIEDGAYRFVLREKSSTVKGTRLVRVNQIIRAADGSAYP